MDQCANTKGTLLSESEVQTDEKIDAEIPTQCRNKSHSKGEHSVFALSVASINVRMSRRQSCPNSRTEDMERLIVSITALSEGHL